MHVMVVTAVHRSGGADRVDLGVVERGRRAEAWGSAEKRKLDSCVGHAKFGKVSRSRLVLAAVLASVRSADVHRAGHL
jgi:hypothetical protein